MHKDMTYQQSKISIPWSLCSDGVVRWLHDDIFTGILWAGLVNKKLQKMKEKKLLLITPLIWSL